jgi:hypothetical protein
MFYKNLPIESSGWILPLDIDKILSDFNLKYSHDWIHLNTVDVLSTAGKLWFLKRNIHLEPTCSLFVAQPNTYSPIHVDHKINDSAFNFILKGYGEMQWIKMDADEYDTDIVIPSGATVHYTRFKNIRGMSALALWTGHAGLVKTNVPHRVVTMDSLRVCLSIRSRHLFDDLSKLF